MWRRPVAWLTRATRTLVIACVPTADAIRGPFYRRDAPWRSRLCPPEEPGEPLTMTGSVTRLPDCGPADGAILDIWQTNARGLYSNMLGLGDRANPRTFHLRGRLRADEHGHYRFDSVVPGRYPLFWPLTRPRHVHLIVTHPSCKPLVTQIYFEGDEYNRWDPWWQPSLTITLAAQIGDAGRRGWRGVCNLVLQLE